jgi:hypothetical protein
VDDDEDNLDEYPDAGEDIDENEDSDDNRLTELESCRRAFPNCICTSCIKYSIEEDADCCRDHRRDCNDAKPCEDFEGYPDKNETEDNGEDDGYIYDEPEVV